MASVYSARSHAQNISDMYPCTYTCCTETPCRRELSKCGGGDNSNDRAWVLRMRAGLTYPCLLAAPAAACAQPRHPCAPRGTPTCPPDPRDPSAPPGASTRWSRQGSHSARQDPPLCHGHRHGRSISTTHLCLVATTQVYHAR